MLLTVQASQGSPQRTVHAIQRFLRTGLVSGADVVRWAFGTPSLLTLHDPAANDLAWELVDLAVSQTAAHVQVGGSPSPGLCCMYCFGMRDLKRRSYQRSTLHADQDSICKLPVGPKKGVYMAACALI